MLPIRPEADPQSRSLMKLKERFDPASIAGPRPIFAGRRSRWLTEAGHIWCPAQRVGRDQSAAGRLASNRIAGWVPLLDLGAGADLNGAVVIGDRWAGTDRRVA